MKCTRVAKKIKATGTLVTGKKTEKRRSLAVSQEKERHPQKTKKGETPFVVARKVIFIA